MGMFDELSPDDANKMLQAGSEIDGLQEAIDSDKNTFDVLEESRVTTPAEEATSLEAFGIAAGKGAVRGLQGIEGLFELVTGDDTDDVSTFLGLPSKEAQEEAFAPLEERFPISTTLGEIAGETGALLPAGAGAGALASKAVGAASGGALASRFLPAAATGVTEGAIIGAADDEAAFGSVVGGTTAIAAEALLPPLARRLKRFFGKAKPLDELVDIVDGKVTPTKETIDVLDEIDVDFEDILSESQKELLKPEQAAVKGAFQAEGIEPASRTRIRPNVSDIQKEGFLLRQSDSEAADQFRDRVVAENEAIKNRFTEIADELGVTGEEGGEKLKSALFGIKSNMRSARNKAYEDLAEVAADKPELLKKIPLNEERLFNSVAEADKFGLDDSTEKAVVRAFEDFGLTEKAERKGGLATLIGEGEVEKLNISNLHGFRKRINSVFDNTKPKEVLARKEIIGAIDDIESEIVDAFDGADFDTPKVIQDAAKRARQSVIDERRVFNQSDVIEQLVAPKRAGLNAKESPLVASSKAFDKLTTAATPQEGVRKLVDTLIEDGSDESLEALGNLQASTMLDLLDSSVQTSKRMVNKQGTTVDVFSGTRLQNRINKIGDDKIKAIFKNNPSALNSLKRLRKITEATITPDEAIQKGSLPPSVLNKAFESISSAKGVPVAGGLAGAAEEARSRGFAKKLKDFSVSQDDLVDFIVLEDNPRVKKLLQASGIIAPTATVVTATGAATDEQ